MSEQGAPLAKLSRAAVEGAADPDKAIVDSVFDFLMDHYDDELAPRQRVAALALLYENEVDNGGHLQYFHNQGIGEADRLLAALEEIGAVCQRDIFARALAYARAHPVEQADSLDDYAERAYEQEFANWDKAFYACRPQIGNDLLAAYILAHLSDFALLE